MGIPTYTRWLCRKYPLILKQLNDVSMGQTDSQNTNNAKDKRRNERTQFDNFYIDMNGILHDCAHGPTLSSIPRNNDDVFENLQK